MLDSEPPPPESEYPVAEIVSVDPCGVEDGSAFRGVPWKLSDVALGVGVLLLWRLVTLVRPDWLESLPAWAILVGFFVFPFAWLLLFPLWVARARRAGALFRKPGVLKFFKEAGISLLVTGAWFGLIIAAMVVVTLLFGEGTVPEGPYRNVRPPADVSAAIALLICLVALAPVAEEIFFRGFLYNALRGRCRTVIAMIVQAAVFAAVHPYAPFFLAVIFLLGLLLAGVYQWRKTLLAPIFVHAGINTVAAAAIAAVMIYNANRPLLGVAGEAHPDGCRVTNVLEGSSAHKAGLKQGDVINRFEEYAITDIEDLINAVREREVGDRVRIWFLRDGRELVKKVVLQPPP